MAASTTATSLLEPEDLFNSSYVPNNPSLVLDTAFWKNGTDHVGQENGEQEGALVHLQPILVEQIQNSNEETYFLNQEESLSNCFTLPSGAQEDLSEFLIPNQSEILTVVTSTTTTTELENETLNAVNSSSTILNNNNNNNNPTDEISSENTNLQELTLPNLEQLDTFLVTSSSSIEPSSQQQQQESEENMHTSLPSMVRGYASTTDYTVNWSMNAIENREIDVQDLSERRIKVSPSSSPRHVSYDHFQNSIGNGQFCTNTHPVFSEVSNISGSGGHGLGGGNNGPSSWQDSSSNQTDFHLTSAVSAAAAAMALSPSHLGYINQDTSYHQQPPGWSSPHHHHVENPTDLSYNNQHGGNLQEQPQIPDCTTTNNDLNSSSQIPNSTGGFAMYHHPNYNGYYHLNGGVEEVLYQDKSEFGLPNHHHHHPLSHRGIGTRFDASSGTSRFNFSFRSSEDQKSPSLHSSSDQELDLNSPRGLTASSSAADELGLFSMMQQQHPSSPDSSTDTSKNVCNVCGKTYARPSTLKTHMRTHSGERPYRCFECDKSFSQAANLTAHCRTHSGEKPFNCGICNRRFSQSSSVTTHMRTHNGERPYKCRHCRKAFSDSSTLTKHLRIHSGEKPYQCKLCHLRFSQSGNLNRHMRIHEQQQQQQQMHHHAHHRC